MPRSRGLLTLGIAAALAAAGAALALGQLDAAAVLAIAAALFFIGRHVPAIVSAVIAIAVIACMMRFATSEDNVVPALMLLTLPYLGGCAVRSRDEIARELDLRAVELEAERELYADLSVRYERARIASELHDIVAHAMSVMVVQASAGQRLAERDPAATSEAFAAISSAARQAEADVRRLVALLGEDAAVGSPDLAVIEELVARAAATGLDVTLRLVGRREGLTAAAVEIAYAVVRESITNALRYAAGAPVDVRIDGGGPDLVVEVVNGPAEHAPALAGHGTGSGLGGMRERVGQSAGRFEAGPTDDGGWQVSARVPRR